MCLRRWVPALALLLGCAEHEYSAEMDVPDARAEASLGVWRERGFPGGTCAEEVSQLHLVIAPGQRVETDALCGAENAGMNVLGCFFYDGDLPTIVARSQMSDFEAVMEHELRHWLLMCSGVDGTGDPAHSDPGVWYRTVLRDGWSYGKPDPAAGGS